METQTPVAKRLNRRAAVAAVLIAGAMILTIGALVTAAPQIGERDPQGPVADPTPREPRFLERAPVPPPIEHSGGLAGLLDGGAVPAGDMAYETDPPAYWAGDPYGVEYGSATAPPAPDPVAEARQRALSAGILSSSRTSTAAAEPEIGAVLGEAASAVPARSRLLNAEVKVPGSGYEIPAGTMLHAVLVSAVNSDAPGDAVAMLTHDVYDRAMTRVLIPRTSRLIGRPSGAVAMGQRRLSLVWDRLVMPDGRTVLLPEIPSQDATGASAHAAEVDSHTGSVMRSALLLSLVGSAAQLSQPQQSATWGQAPSVGQTVAGAAGAQLAQTSGEMIRRGMDIRPTLSLRQGMQLNILLTADLALDPYR